VLVTNQAMYHFHPRKYTKARKCIPLTAITGISIASDSFEVVVCVHLFSR
jgi:hypothetical protein